MNDVLKPIPLCTCPSCGVEMGSALNAAGQEDRGPKPGHRAVCVMCSAVLQFDADMMLRLVDPTTLSETEQRALAEMRAQVEAFWATEAARRGN